MATTNINVTLCDNELYLIAYNNLSTQSYEICHIQSGYSFGVNVTVNLSPGVWVGRHATTNGLSGPINTSYSLSLPAGSYTLIAVGINWGLPGTTSPAAFAFTVNSQAPAPITPLPATQMSGGVCWPPLGQGTPITIS